MAGVTPLLNFLNALQLFAPDSSQRMESNEDILLSSVNISAPFPSLKSFWIYQSVLQDTIPENILAYEMVPGGLPAALKHFKTRNVRWINGIEWSKNLPQTIEVFSTGHFNFNEKSPGAVLYPFTHPLPDTLTTLYCTLGIETSVDLSLELSWPPSLTKLILQWEQKKMGFGILAGSIPINLALSRLPSTLKILHIRAQELITVEHLALIPPSVTCLTLKGKGPFDIPANCLPPNLTSLDTQLGLDSQTVPLLPRSITKIRVSNLFHVLLTLPNSIEHAGTYGRYFLALEDLGRLPRGLKNLDSLLFLSGVVNEEHWSRLPFGIEQLTVTMPEICNSFELPQRLTTLHITCQSVHPQMLLSLPKTLTKLNLSTVLDLTDPSILGPAIKETWLPHLKSFVKGNLAMDEGETITPTLLVSSLPDTLESLDIADPFCAATIFNVLPRNLELLRLQGTVEHNDDCIKLLPRTLTHLQLNTQGPMEVTAASFIDLPRSLYVLRLAGEPEDSDLYGLSVLDFPEELGDLPPFLSRRSRLEILSHWFQMQENTETE